MRRVRIEESPDYVSDPESIYSSMTDSPKPVAVRLTARASRSALPRRRREYARGVPVASAPPRRDLGLQKVPKAAGRGRSASRPASAKAVSKAHREACAKFIKKNLDDKLDVYTGRMPKEEYLKLRQQHIAELVAPQPAGITWQQHYDMEDEELFRIAEEQARITLEAMKAASAEAAFRASAPSKPSAASARTRSRSRRARASAPTRGRLYYDIKEAEADGWRRPTIGSHIGAYEETLKDVLKRIEQASAEARGEIDWAAVLGQVVKNPNLAYELSTDVLKGNSLLHWCVTRDRLRSLKRAVPMYVRTAGTYSTHALHTYVCTSVVASERGLVCGPLHGGSLPVVVREVQIVCTHLAQELPHALLFHRVRP